MCRNEQWLRSVLGLQLIRSTRQWLNDGMFKHARPGQRDHAPVRLAAGDLHTCALLSDGAMRCWGLNDDGQLGNRRRTTTPTPGPSTLSARRVWCGKAVIPQRRRSLIRGRATGRAIGNTTITATTAGFINDNAVLTVK